MSDEIQETPGAATRNLLGAIGFILILLGGEILLEKTGDRFPLGIGLIIVGVPIFFVGVFWKWLQRRLATGIAKKLNWIASDPIWWVALFSVFASFSFTQFGLLPTALVLAPLGAAYAIFAWRRAGGATTPYSGGSLELADAQWRNQRDAQAKLDFVHLFHFAVAQATVHMLEGLIRTAEGPEITDAFKSGEDSDAAHEAKKWFVGFARGKLGHGNEETDRRTRFSSIMHEMEGEAERNLEAIPQEQRPSGDQLRLRRHAIADAQFARAVLFLKREKRAVEEKLIGQRHGLIERLTEREKPQGR